MTDRRLHFDLPELRSVPPNHLLPPCGDFEEGFHFQTGGCATGTPARMRAPGHSNALGKRRLVEIDDMDCEGLDPPKAHSHHKEPCHMGASNRGWDASLELAHRLQAEDQAAAAQEREKLLQHQHVLELTLLYSHIKLKP